MCEGPFSRLRVGWSDSSTSVQQCEDGYSSQCQYSSPPLVHTHTQIDEGGVIWRGEGRFDNMENSLFIAFAFRQDE